MLHKLVHEDIPKNTKDLNEIFSNKSKISIEVDIDSLHMNRTALTYVDNVGLFRAVCGVRGAAGRSEVRRNFLFWKIFLVQH